MAKKKNVYSDDSIISLNGRDFCRLRPATYLGSNEYSTQLVREVFSNALDEHNIGHGNLITIDIDTKANEYTVKDNGQGFPINVVRDDGETVLQAAFDVINTSGKYSDDGVYGGSSLGLNGIGSKLTNFLSKKLTVTSINDGKYESCSFEDGLFTGRDLGSSSSPNGTTVSWVPDEQFFQNKSANLSDLKKLFEDISALCPELTIELTVDGKSTTYHSENGLNDLVDKKVGDREILGSRFNIRKVVTGNLFDICLTYSSDYSDSTTAYVNYGLTESGIHISTVRSQMTKCLNKFAMANGLIKKESEEFSSSEFNEGLVLVFNVKSTNVKYDSQTKTRVVDLDRSLISQVMRGDFMAWLDNNPKEAKLIIERARVARKAKEAAQKAKDNIRNASTRGNTKFINLPTKLVDAFSKDRKECELFITEGDSAANGLIAKRDGKTQGVFPIRGKILSCRKATMDKIYGNQEIANIVKAIGLDINKDTGLLVYDSKKLRYHKIILAADADADGYDIRMLLINMFWSICPELVTNGHIYVALPPLFRVTTKKNDYIFLRNSEELEKYKEEHKGESFLINRNKGLGESDASELAEYLLRPATRNVEQLTVNDAVQTDELLEIFMGPKVEPRREYLLSNM